jgi:hypothetical protein
MLHRPARRPALLAQQAVGELAVPVMSRRQSKAEDASSGDAQHRRSRS